MRYDIRVQTLGNNSEGGSKRLINVHPAEHRRAVIFSAAQKKQCPGLVWPRALLPLRIWSAAQSLIGDVLSVIVLSRSFGGRRFGKSMPMLRQHGAPACKDWGGEI